MRAALLLLLPCLAGCHPAATPVVALAAAEAVSVATFHRDGFDLGYSLVTGRDCSIVHLEQGQRYCKPREPAPAEPPFCTRTLGAAECFADPSALPDHPSGVADAPSLNSAQERDRLARWPNW